MSNKITGKNLYYDQSLPHFLARLKRQHVADADSPDPILASRRRQAKPRSASEEAEDGPVIVDDDGNILAGIEVAANGTVTSNTDAGAGAEANAAEGGSCNETEKEEGGNEARGKEKVAIVGSCKKRKAGKVVGIVVGVGKGEYSSVKEERANAKGNQPATCDKFGIEDGTRATAKHKKKANKIKLSFGDDFGN